MKRKILLASLLISSCCIVGCGNKTIKTTTVQGKIEHIDLRGKYIITAIEGVKTAIKIDELPLNEYGYWGFPYEVGDTIYIDRIIKDGALSYKYAYDKN